MVVLEFLGFEWRQWQRFPCAAADDIARDLLYVNSGVRRMGDDFHF